MLALCSDLRDLAVHPSSHCINQQNGSWATLSSCYGGDSLYHRGANFFDSHLACAGGVSFSSQEKGTAFRGEIEQLKSEHEENNLPQTDCATSKQENDTLSQG